jgi:CDP-glucose 4,6-dehydratase
MENMEGLKGARVMVTGGTGLVGSHLVELLLLEGASVVVPVRTHDPFSYFFLGKFDKKCIMPVYDLKDYRRVYDIVTKYEIEYIFHLGAQPIVETAYYNPRETIESNIIGTTNILEAAREYPKIKGIIVASSDKAYGKKNEQYVETDALKGDHPYEVSKSACDLVATMYYKTYGLPIVITRFGNIYGPGDINFNRIIPGIMKTLYTNETLLLRSNGLYIRDYIYVQDVALAYLFLMNRLSNIKGNAYNIAADNSYSVIGLIQLVEKILKLKVPYKIINNAQNEIPVQKLSWEKIRKLGWTPKYSMKFGMLKTNQWYKNYFKTL